MWRRNLGVGKTLLCEPLGTGWGYLGREERGRGEFSVSLAMFENPFFLILWVVFSLSSWEGCFEVQLLCF